MMLTRTVLIRRDSADDVDPADGGNVAYGEGEAAGEAEHVCYDDAQMLCPDAVPDEAKVTVCMKVKKASLSPACRKVFDRGMGL